MHVMTMAHCQCGCVKSLVFDDCAFKSSESFRWCCQAWCPQARAECSQELALAPHVLLLEPRHRLEALGTVLREE